MTIEIYRRRIVKRKFAYVDLIKMFNLSPVEMFMNAYYDKDNNCLVVESLLDHDEGDI